MKTIHLTTALLICIVVCIPSPSQADDSSAKNDDQFISVGGYNNSWILNKTTGRLIFVQFKKKDKLWKSEVVSIPASYDLNHSVLIPAGAKVNSVFLHDQSSGMATLFTVKGDHSVEKYLDYNAGEDLKLVYTPKTETSAKLPLRKESNNNAGENLKLVYTPKTKTSAKLPLKLPLRKEPKKLLERDIRKMLARYGFYDADLNWRGSFANDFVDNGYDTITDRATGLMWQKKGSSRTKKWKRAQEYVKRLNKDVFAGHSDWRLPTIEELASLVEREKVNGVHIDPVFDSKQKTCWSADYNPTSTIRVSGYEGWIVKFTEGTIIQTIWSLGTYHGYGRTSWYIRAVRSVK